MKPSVFAESSRQRLSGTGAPNGEPGSALALELVMVDKKANSAGLQFSDLVARPIGRHVLKPSQPNRAWDVLQGEFRTSPSGRLEGWGLKVFP